MTRVPINGICLNVEEGAVGAPVLPLHASAVGCLNAGSADRDQAVLLLHGFTGSIRSWDAHAPLLAALQRVIAVDLIGHGQSDAPEDWQRYSMEHCVEDLLALLDALDVTDFDLIGYSMGGRVALQLAAAAPERIHRLILESGSPGLADPAEREARIAADEQLAQVIERDGLRAFVDLWERVPLFASQMRLPADVRARVRAQRLASDPRGLANSLRGMGTGRQTSLWGRLLSLQAPARLLAGMMDVKYCEIAGQMARQWPAATVQTIADAGHTIHLERPDAFQEAVLDFLYSGRLRRWQPTEA